LNLPTIFFNSNEFKQASNDAVVVYMVLRCDATQSTLKSEKILGSELDALEVATITNLVVPTTKRSLEELIKRKWIKKVKGNYILGFIEDVDCRWFLDDMLNDMDVNELGLPDALRMAEKLKRKLAVDKKSRSDRLSDETKRKVIGTVFPENEEIRSKDIVKKFKALYKLKYGEDSPMIESSANSNKYATTYVYVGRAIKWSSSRQEVMDVIDLMFDKWDELKKAFGLDGRPSLHMLGSSKLYPRFASCIKDGIPKRRKQYAREDITDRFDGELKDVGW